MNKRENVVNGRTFRSIPLVHENLVWDPSDSLPTVLIIIGRSGSGKDSILRPLFDKCILERITTLTTRPRRYVFAQNTPPEEQNRIEQELSQTFTAKAYEKQLKMLASNKIIEIREDENDYIFADSKKEDEPLDEFIERTQLKHDLIEWDWHHGNLYGIPRASLEKAIHSKEVPVLRVDEKACATLIEQYSSLCNFLVIAVVAEDQEIYKNRIYKRAGLIDSNSTGAQLAVLHALEARLQEDEEKAKFYHSVTHFYLVNPEEKLASRSGAELARESLIKLLKALELL